MQGFAQVAIVLLAAGEAARFGSPKQIASIGQRAMVRHCAINALGTQAPVFVVTGAHRAEVETALGGLMLRIVYNAEWASGMGSSLSCGVRAARAQIPALRGVMIALADQPSISAQDLGELLSRHARMPDRIVVSRSGGRIGSPCVFPAARFDELENLGGPAGAREIILRHAGDCHAVDVPAAALDIDTREDYRRFLENGDVAQS